MKKLFLFLMVAAMMQVGKAQDFTKVKTFVFLPGQAENAKTEIDKIMATPKGQSKAEGWILKAKVYSGLYADDKLRAKYPGSEIISAQSYEKYKELDPSFKVLKEDGLQSFAAELYGTSFGQGVRTYNGKIYDSAAYYFKLSVIYSDIIFENHWGKDSTMKFDTTSILYAGVSFEKANKKDSAALFYGRIAQYKLTKINGSDMLDIYKWLVDFYFNQKHNDAEAMKYIQLGKELYPSDLLWPDTELDMARKSGNKDELFAKYEEITTKEIPQNQIFMYNYGVELYNYAIDTSSGKKPANSEQLIAKAKEKLNQTLQLDSTYVQAALLLGQIIYNEAVDLKATASLNKGTKPEDKQKRIDIRNAAAKKFDEAIPYLERVDRILGSQGKLKMDNKSILKNAYDLLITIYEQKNVKDKSDAYTNKFNNVDKDH